MLPEQAHDAPLNGRKGLEGRSHQDAIVAEEDGIDPAGPAREARVELWKDVNAPSRERGSAGCSSGPGPTTTTSVGWLFVSSHRGRLGGWGIGGGGSRPRLGLGGLCQACGAEKREKGEEVAEGYGRLASLESREKNVVFSQDEQGTSRSNKRIKSVHFGASSHKNVQMVTWELFQRQYRLPQTNH
jgi:hypothetical protein